VTEKDNKEILVSGKKKKKFEEVDIVKENQEFVCSFVIAKLQKVEKIGKKVRYVGANEIKGLQIENKIYLLDGNSKLVNAKSMKIIKRFKGIPEWSSVELTNKYNDFKEKTDWAANWTEE